MLKGKKTMKKIRLCLCVLMVICMTSGLCSADTVMIRVTSPDEKTEERAPTVVMQEKAPAEPAAQDVSDNKDLHDDQTETPAAKYTLPYDDSPGMPLSGAFTTDLMTYDDPTIHVQRYRIYNHETAYNCTIHYAKIQIAHGSQLRTASCNGFNSRVGNTVDKISQRVNAVVSINGDFIGSHRDGYILRQGVVYRDNIERLCDLLLIDEDGDFHIIYYNEDQTVDKTTWNGKKVINVFTFGPALIVNDEVVLDKKADPAYADAPGRGARTCIVQTGKLEYMVLTVRELGCSLEEMITLIQQLTDHVECAYLLDGGRTASMAFMGRLVNKLGSEAIPVTDIVYFASAWPGE